MEIVNRRTLKNDVIFFRGNPNRLFFPLALLRIVLDGTTRSSGGSFVHRSLRRMILKARPFYNWKFFLKLFSFLAEFALKLYGKLSSGSSRTPTSSRRWRSKCGWCPQPEEPSTFTPTTSGWNIFNIFRSFSWLYSLCDTIYQVSLPRRIGQISPKLLLVVIHRFRI